MPKLQSTISGSISAMKRFTDELEKIENEMKTAAMLDKDDNEIIQRCEKFLSENESSKVPEVVDRVNKRRAEKAAAEKSIEDRKTQVDELKKDRDAIENDPAYQQMSKDVKEARKKLDGIFETLEKDPIINEKLQEAIKYEYFQAIEAQKSDVVQFSELGPKLEASLKDASSNGLKTLAESTAKRRDTVLKGIDDDSIDIKKARSNYRNSVTALKSQIKTKFGVEVESKEDIDYILDFAYGKVTGEFKLPSAEAKLEKSDRIIKKLEEKRDERLAELSGKVEPVAAPEHAQEIEDNQRVIEELEKENTETLSPGIAEATQKIDEIETKIDEKTKVTPEQKRELEDAEKALKDNHIISDEVVTDLKDENSDISKLFKEFVDADKELRKAFRKNEHDKTDDAKQVLEDAIIKYKGIAEQLANGSGYDIESWQNYNKGLINEQIIAGKTVDSVYMYPTNRRLYGLIDDKRVKKDDEAREAYYGACEKLDEIDEQELNILDGDFSGVPNLTKLLEEYHTSVENIQSNAGPNLDVYGVIRGNALTKVSWTSKVRDAFGKFFDRSKQIFDIPDKKITKNLIGAYLSKKPGANLSQADKDELKQLENEKQALTESRKVLQDKRADNETKIANLENKNAALATQDAAKQTSELGSQEERSFVTREGLEAKGYVEGKSVKEDIKKVIDDEER